jgi:hypothetical protein
VMVVVVCGARIVTGEDLLRDLGQSRRPAASARAISRARSVAVSSYGDCSTTSAETIRSSGPATGSGAIVFASSLAELLRVILPKRGAGGPGKLHLGPYNPLQDLHVRSCDIYLAMICCQPGKLHHGHSHHGLLKLGG